MATGARCSPACQRWQGRASQEQLQAIIVEPNPQLMPDQPGWHGVEHLAHGEAPGGRDAQRDLLVIRDPPRRQRSEARTFRVDPLGIPRIDPAHDLVDEATIVLQAFEVARPTHDQRVLNGALQMPIGVLNGTVLVCDALVVARRHHSIMAAQGVEAVG